MLCRAEHMPCDAMVGPPTRVTAYFWEVDPSPASKMFENSIVFGGSTPCRSFGLHSFTLICLLIHPNNSFFTKVYSIYYIRAVWWRALPASGLRPAGGSAGRTWDAVGIAQARTTGSFCEVHSRTRGASKLRFNPYHSITFILFVVSGGDSG